ncbi:MAG: tetratricopeptide repeat protein [Candidatus Sulfotelmatobacter sp.]
MSGWRHPVFLYIALICATVILYWPVLTHPFINYDDDTYVTANSHVQSGLNRQSLAWALTSTEQSNWHPLTWMSHELDCQIYGLRPAGHHFTNLGLHVVNVLLLFIVLSFATRATKESFLVALLFAIHPLNVESVAWVAERKNVLSTLFFLLAIGVYCLYARKLERKWYALALLMFLCGLASKPMVITLPFVLLLLDYWPLERVSQIAPHSSLVIVPQRSWSRLLLEKAPFFLLSIGSAVVTIFAQNSGGAIKSLAEMPFGLRVENAIWAYAEYLLKVLWPSSLAVHYPHSGTTLPLWKVVSAALVLAGISAFVWRAASRRPYLLVGWCWFLGTLVPVIGLIQVGNQALADRYMYIPIIGLMLMLVWGASDFLKDKLEWRVQLATVGIVVATLLLVSHHQIGYWKSSYDLWSHALEVTQNNYVAEDNLGETLATLGRNDEALHHFYEAKRISSADPSSRVNIAAILQSRGEVRQAVIEYSAAIKIASANPDIRANAKPLSAALANLGTLYSVNGDYEKARENYRQALRINPTALDDLIAKFYKFAASQPTGKKYLWLAEILEQTGRTREARDAYERALRADPTLVEAQASLQRLDHSSSLMQK